MTKLKCLQITKNLDYKWMVSFNIFEKSPMLTDLNTEQFIEECSIERAEYMKYIPFPPLE